MRLYLSWLSYTKDWGAVEESASLPVRLGKIDKLSYSIQLSSPSVNDLRYSMDNDIGLEGFSITGSIQESALRTSGASHFISHKRSFLQFQEPPRKVSHEPNLVDKRYKQDTSQSHTNLPTTPSRLCTLGSSNVPSRCSSVSPGPRGRNPPQDLLYLQSKVGKTVLDTGLECVSYTGAQVDSCHSRSPPSGYEDCMDVDVTLNIGGLYVRLGYSSRH